MAGPTGTQLINESEFFKFVSKGQVYPIQGGAKSTSSINGTASYAATTHSVSDLLQGSLFQLNPQDELLRINKALTDNLANIYQDQNAAIHGFSSFSTILPGVTSSGSGGSGNLSNVDANGWPIGFVTEGAEAAAYAAIQAGFTGEDLFKIVAIAGRESGWDPSAINKSSNDTGMWQIAPVNWGEFSQQELLDPLKNAQVAFKLFSSSGFHGWKAASSRVKNSNGVWVVDPSGRGGAGWASNGDELWHTENFQNEARAAIQSVTQSLNAGTFQFSTGSAMGSVVQNTIEEFKYAGEKLANHRNFWAAHNQSGFKSLLINGFGVSPANVKYVPTYFSEIGRAFLMPSLLNYLWYILEADFVLGDYWGSYVHRHKNFDPKQDLSNHSFGGAIDIGSLGLAGETPIGVSSSRWRSYNDQLWQTMSTYSRAREVKPAEIGSSFAYTYNGWFKVFRDDNPNHIHLGFTPDQVGKLDRALLPPVGRGGGGGSSGSWS